MYIEIEKSGETRSVKTRYLQNFLDQGWKPVVAKKTTPAAAKKITATADVTPVEDWDPESGEDWADSEESTIEKGES